MIVGHTHLPLKEPHERRLLRPLLRRVVALPLPTAERFNWLDYSPLYYKADPQVKLEPIRFEYEDHECYNKQQAEAIWYSRGCKSTCI